MMKFNFIAISLFILSACSNMPAAVKPVYEGGLKRNSVFVVNHGLHTGFVIPATAIKNKLPELGRRFGIIPYIEFGWGDKDFYQAEDFSIGLTFSALFFPTDTVMHTVAVPESPEKYFASAQVKEICLDDNEYAGLISFIENSFLKSEDNKLISLKNGLYGDSQFYQAQGSYTVMNTCNNWTAKGLASAGFEISTTFKLTSGSVMGYLNDQPTGLGKQNQCSYYP